MDASTVTLTPECVLGILLNRGLRPVIDESGRLVVRGAFDPTAGMDGPLARVVGRMRKEITRLVACGWTPEVVNSKNPSRPRPVRTEPLPEFVSPPVPAVRSFDWEMERLVRDLYAADYGVRFTPNQGGALTPRVFPSDPSAALSRWLARMRPVRDRFVAHLAPRDFVDPKGRAWGRENGFPVSKYPVHVLEFLDEKYPEGHPFHAERVFFCHAYRGLDSRWHREAVPHPFDLPVPAGKSQWRYAGEGYWRMTWGRWETSENKNRLEFRPWGWRPGSKKST